MPKKPNSWIQHVKAVAKEKGLSYMDALKHPLTKSSYKKISGGSLNVEQIPSKISRKKNSI